MNDPNCDSGSSKLDGSGAIRIRGAQAGIWTGAGQSTDGSASAGGWGGTGAQAGCVGAAGPA
ncbi:MAG: hypothetical protein ACHQ0J_13815, partial [Candidatus Dormibacterales bacterium]